MLRLCGESNDYYMLIRAVLILPFHLLYRDSNVSNSVGISTFVRLLCDSINYE
jgi:hypothetical protein